MLNVPSNPLLIVDKDGRIIAVFVGKPDDPEWDTKVVPGACRALDRAWRTGVENGAFSSADRVHRRGTFLSVTFGASFGGGQLVIFLAMDFE